MHLTHHASHITHHTARAIEQGKWSGDQREKFAAALHTQLARARALDTRTMADIRRLLRDAQGEIRDRLLRAIAKIAKGETGRSAFDMARTGSTIQEIDRILRDLQGPFARMTREASEEAADIGRNLMDAPLRLAIGTDVLPVHQLPRSTVAAAANFMETRLARVSQDALRQISGELQFGAIGVKDPYEVMQAVGRNLTDPSIFGSIAVRAETITRTGMGLIHSMAGQLRQEEAAQVVRGMKKQWAWSGKSRITHAAAHGQIREVWGDYDVGGEKLSFPRDPKGSPGNTINCGCDSLPFIEGLSEELPPMTGGVG